MVEVEVDALLVVPGGWVRPDDLHTFLYVLHRRPRSFALTVCNVGEGSDYLGMIMEAHTCKSKRNLAFTLEDIPLERLLALPLLGP